MDRARHTTFKILSTQTFALICLLLSACSDSDTGPTQDDKPQTAAQAQRFIIIDRGMNMPVGAFTIPPGWSLNYDVFTNTHTARYDRFLIDIRGPDSMLIRGLGLESYSHYVNQNFNGVVELMVMSGLRGIDGLNFGQFSESTLISQSQRFQTARQAANAQNMEMQALQLPFSGNIAGRDVAGSIEVLHTLFYAQGQHTGGAIQVKLILGSAEQLQELITLSHSIDKTFESYPHYDSARSKVIDAVTARQTAEHRQRMAAQQAQFNNHQQMMQDRYQSAYQQNQQWLENFRNDGASTQSGYSQHQRFIDTINEATSFDDAGAGGRVTRAGNYDRWATDGQGNYIGSDNANFNPDALGGDWHEATPLR